MTKCVYYSAFEGDPYKDPYIQTLAAEALCTPTIDEGAYVKPMMDTQVTTDKTLFESVQDYFNNTGGSTPVSPSIDPVQTTAPTGSTTTVQTTQAATTDTPVTTPTTPVVEKKNSWLWLLVAGAAIYASQKKGR